MPKITYITHDGTSIATDVAVGTTLMAAGLSLNLEGIVGDCGGCCTCATCRIDIDPAWSDRLPPAYPEEAEMLQFSRGAGPQSRLACQLRCSEQLDGLVVHVPAEQALV
jgi:2Fe-2S ferredoxin